MKQSAIDYEILADGTVTITTSDLSGPNHMSADQLLEQLADALGGPVATKKRNKFHVHNDLSGALHSHARDGHTHQY